jgi:hypothetical protein
MRAKARLYTRRYNSWRMISPMSNKTFGILLC